MLIREIAFLDPAEAAARLRPFGDLALLDSAMPHPTLGRHAFVAADPFSRVAVDRTGALVDGRRVAGPPILAIRAALSRFRLEPRPDLPPFRGGALGHVAYEFAHHLERLDAPTDIDAVQPSLRLGLYDTVVALDVIDKRAWLFASGFPEMEDDARRARASARLARFEAALSGPAPPPPRRFAPPPGSIPVTSNFSPERFAAAVERVRDYILSGDIYQANIAQTFEATLPADFDAFAFHLALRAANPAPFAAFLETGPLAVSASSPERFLKLLPGGRVETRPIKGTAARDLADPLADARAAEALLASEKDRAENVMIVDLMRNDLSRVCEPDSVAVPVLCGLETYASVHHLTSVVTGRLAPGRDALDLLAATFPGGSITGAPKIRAMDIITQIEAAARGPYCGSIGYIGFDGAMDLNIAIRTVSMSGATARFQAGGGITVLSDGAAEYRETLAKAGRILSAFGARPSAGSP